MGSLQYLLVSWPDIAYVVNRLSQFIHRNSSFDIHAFTNADWGGKKDDFSSMGAYIIYLGRNPVSWSSKKQRTVARSSTEAEYRSAANTAAEDNWICSLLLLHIKVSQSPVIYCDNAGATQLFSNPVFHSRMKYVAIDFHFIREHVQTSDFCVAHVSSQDQLADALIKSVPRPCFLQLKDKIGLLHRRPSWGGMIEENTPWY